MAVALLELGFRTCHTCFDASLYDKGDAFLDTPIYVDYPALDSLYPGSKYILTWRDPHEWLESFARNLAPYFNTLLRNPCSFPLDPIYVTNRRCYTQVLGMPDAITDELLLDKYQCHRIAVEHYFRQRPNDLLILDLDASFDPWSELCDFLGCPRPTNAFPQLNTAGISAWEDLHHPLKVASFRS